MGPPQTAADLGLMQGYPVPPEKRVTREKSGIGPWNRWAFQHMRELGATAEIWRGTGPISEFDIAPVDLDDVTFTSGTGERRTVTDMLDIAYVDAIVVLHHGKLAYERFRNGMRPTSQHLMMSVTKSLVGTLAAQLGHEGLIDLDAHVSHYVPELAESAWGDATVRHALDMTTGVRFQEVYMDETSDIARFGIAAGWRPAPADYDGPFGTAAYLATVPKEGDHGWMYHYVTPNTAVVDWAVTRATDRRFSDLLSERIWSKLGMERDAYISVDPIGMEAAGGGFNATARDLARFGQMILQNGVWNGEQIVAPAVIADIHRGGDRDAFARGTSEYGPLFQGWSYRSFWWITHNAHGAFTGIGINGQFLYIDPTADMVLVLQSSHPSPDLPDGYPVVLPGFHAIARHLLDRG